MAASHAQASCQRTRWHNAGALSGPSGPPEAGGPQKAHGCQTGCFLQTELSHREGRQHRDLHPRGPDEALRSTVQVLMSTCKNPPHKQPMCHIQPSSSCHHVTSLVRLNLPLHCHSCVCLAGATAGVFTVHPTVKWFSLRNEEQVFDKLNSYVVLFCFFKKTVI